MKDFLRGMFGAVVLVGMLSSSAYAVSYTTPMICDTNGDLSVDHTEGHVKISHGNRGLSGTIRQLPPHTAYECRIACGEVAPGIPTIVECGVTNNRGTLSINVPHALASDLSCADVAISVCEIEAPGRGCVEGYGEVESLLETQICPPLL